ncbi:MAG: ATP-binding cassette domain-containing protein, partial [Spirochaetota bacterium]
DSEAGPSPDWFWMVAGRFRRYLILGSIFSLVLGGLSLLYPVLMTAMYGKLSATSEARFVASLAIGAVLYLSADAGLRFLRGALLDYSSARFGQTIGAEIFRRLLSFQTSFTESAPLDSQIRRVRDFETIADFISGPAFAAIFDVPFLLLNIFWLAAAGPSFLIAPFVAIIVFAVATAAFFPIVRKAQAAFSVEDGLRHDLFARIIAAKSQLSDTAAKESWLSRFSRASRSASLAGYELQRVNGLVSTFSSLVVSLGGLATLYFGILDVFAGKARPEALVVAMLLVWRILEPARSAFVVVTQLDSVMKSVGQIQRFLSLPLELPSLLPRAAGRQPRGGVAFHEVFFRYGSEGYPALSGIGFEVPQGGMFTIGGHAGSGKTTIAKLLLGLYRPQSGRITLGGQNILQMDPALLRRSVAFAPSTAPLFPGSLLANIRLGAPEATDNGLTGIAEEIGLIAALSERGWTLDTVIGPRELDAVPVEVARLIALVRTFARNAGVLIVDEPQKGVPKSSIIRVASLLSRRRDDGDTVIIITNDGFFSSLADMG